jgi:hypothetical protein
MLCIVKYAHTCDVSLMVKRRILNPLIGVRSSDIAPFIMTIRFEIVSLQNFDAILEWLRLNAGNNKFDWLITNGVMVVFIEDEMTATAFKLRWPHD